MKLKGLLKFPPSILAIAIILAAGIYLRYAGLSEHFGHIDDLGVAVTILQYQNTNQFDQSFVEKVLTPKSEWPSAQKLETLKTSDLNQYRMASEAKHIFGEARLKSWTDYGYLNPLLHGANNLLKFVSVPIHWTYAPMQFFLTQALISKHQTYRDILFWGRFPSFLFSSAALFLMVLFYRKYRPSQPFSGLLALALIAFSCENIFYAKQMENYALGVFAVISLLLLLFKNFEKPDFSPLLNGFILALLSYSHYQVIFFAPAFFASIFFYHWSSFRQSFKENILRVISAGLMYAGFIVPLYVCFLGRRASQGINRWNMGPSGEFLFVWNTKLPILESVRNSIAFYFKNFILILNSNLSFIPESSFFSPFIYFLILALFLAGVFSFVSKNDKIKKGFGVFFLMTGAIWCILIAGGKLTLSPTRHNLILLPLMSITVSEGFFYLCEKFRLMFKKEVILPANYAVLGCMLILALSFFPQSMAERRDPFNENKIISLMDRFSAKTVIAYNSTLNLSLMKSVTDKFQYIDERFRLDRPENSGFTEIGNTVALISHCEKLNPFTFERIKELLKRELGITADLSSYRIIYSEEKKSDVEVEFSKRTRSGANGYYFYVLTNRPAV